MNIYKVNVSDNEFKAISTKDYLCDTNNSSIKNN